MPSKNGSKSPTKSKGKSRTVPSTNPDAHRTDNSRSHKNHNEKTHTSKSRTNTEKTHSPTATSRDGTTKYSHSKSHSPNASKDVESGRHPSSSVGSGSLDIILLILLGILGLSTIILFVIGVWLLASFDGWPSGLNNTGNLAWTRTVSYGVACLILSFLFIPIIIFALLAARTRRGFIARIGRLIVVFFVSFAFIVLLLMTVTALFFATNGPGFVAVLINNAWVNSVADAPLVNRVCRIQEQYNCRGWDDNSCRDCNPTVTGVYGQCNLRQRLICPRCFRDQAVIQAAPQPVGTNQASQPAQNIQLIPRPTLQLGRSSTANVKSNKQLLQSKRKTSLPFTVRSQIPGCRRYILRRNREFFIPMTIYTIFLAVIVILIAWKSCLDSSPRY